MTMTVYINQYDARCVVREKLSELFCSVIKTDNYRVEISVPLSCLQYYESIVSSYGDIDLYSCDLTKLVS